MIGFARTSVGAREDGTPMSAPQTVDGLTELAGCFGGLVTRAHIKAAGIHERVVASWVSQGRIVRLHRGVYQIAELGQRTPQTSLASVQLRIPSSVICLETALALHGLTKTFPAATSVAVSRTARAPSISGVSVYRFSSSQLVDIETRTHQGVLVSVFSLEKTLVDLLRYRRALGLEPFWSGLSAYLKSGMFDQNRLEAVARDCRTGRLMLEMINRLKSEPVRV
jgi:predicted transcriptional regulator of viral defense system